MKSVDEKGQLRRANWWIRLTAPTGAANYDRVRNRRDQEHLRKSILTSYIAIAAVIAPLLLIGQAQAQSTMLAIVSLVSMIICALLLNKFGFQMVAAILIVVSLDAAIEGALITAPGGLGAGWIPSLFLFVFPLLVVAALMPRWLIWAVAIVHSAIILGDVYLLPQAPDLVSLIRLWNGPAIAYARPIVVQFITAVISSLLVASADQAIERADRAEEIIALDQEVQELKDAELRQKRDLEEGISAIQKTLADVARGNFRQRVSLYQGNQLWQLTRSLNLLFTRLESNQEEIRFLQHELQKYNKSSPSNTLPPSSPRHKPIS